MNRIYISLRDIPTTRLQLGFEGENDHTQVIFDWTLLYARYPSAVASMKVKSPSGGLYPKQLVQSGKKLVWNISASDCAKSGSGQYQLTFTNGTEVIKTYIGSFSVDSSLIGSGDPPDPIEDWLQEAQEALAAFDQNVTDAEAWAVGTRDGEPVESTDPTYHNNSKYYAEQAGTIEQTIETTGASQVAAIEAKGEEVLESIPSDYTELSEEVDELYAIKAPIIVSSASGSIASFPDGADNMPVKTLTVGIEPVQDLHGQDAPYPAGGGKNLFQPNFESPKTINGTTVTLLSDGRITTSGTPSADFVLVIGYFILQAGSYILNGAPSGGGSGKHYLQITDYPVVNNLGLDSGSGVAFTLESSIEVALRLQIYTGASASLTFAPMVRLASVTDGTFAPYSNVCPISGWTGANVSRTGKNLLNLVESEMISTGWNRAFPISIKEGTYIISCQNQFGASSALGSRVSLADENNVAIKYLTSNYNFGQTEYSGASIAVTKEEANRIKRIFFELRAGNTTYADIAQGNLQLELGSTATTYEPYSGETIEYEFPSSAGTVYGGTLTIHQDGTGELVVDRAMQDLGDLNWTESVDGVYATTGIIGQVKEPSTYNEIPDIICSQYVAESYISLWSEGKDDSITVIWSASGSHGEVWVRDSAFTDATTFKQAMTDNSVQIVYALATPVTYQLTNQQVVSLLKGVNNVWADCGSVSLEYPADTKLYIDGKIAELQALILENISNS